MWQYRKVKSYPALTFDLRNADDLSSLEQEGSRGWLLNCSIRRLFTWEEVSLHSSGSLFIFSENHAFKSLKPRKAPSAELQMQARLCQRILGTRVGGEKNTTRSNMVSQIPTSLDGGCFIIHVGKIFFVLRHSIPQALRYVCSQWPRREDITHFVQVYKPIGKLRTIKLTTIGILLETAILPAPIPWLTTTISHKEESKPIS